MKKAFLLLAALMTAQVNGAQASDIDPKTIVTAYLVNAFTREQLKKFEGISYGDALEIVPKVCREEYNAITNFVTFDSEEKVATFITGFLPMIKRKKW